jgi:hypothetical protein
MGRAALDELLVYASFVDHRRLRTTSVIDVA